MQRTRWIKPAAALVLLGFVGFEIFHWTINRIYVPPGMSLLLRYKGPLIFGSRATATPGQFADPARNEVGVREQLRGPGRHFYCPIWWERKLIEDVVVRPGEVALVTSKLGENLPGEQFLVDGALGQTQFKGILRQVLGPGRYRPNPYAYELKKVKSESAEVSKETKHSGWVAVPTGYVGVVTNLTENPLTGERAGIQDETLPPGIYLVNLKGQQVDIVEIGYREKSVTVTHKTDRTGNPLLDESGEPILDEDSGGIAFPSNDGFLIHMDFTAIWGLMPNQAADAVRKFGNGQAVEDKVVVPQIESICRNFGSKEGAVELLVGETRQTFQEDTLKEFQSVLGEKNVTLLYGLVRHIYIPQEVRIPIQNANIADEMRLTRDQEQSTAKTEALLREAEQKVKLESGRIRVETERKVAGQKAEGMKRAEETRAKTQQLIAAIDRQTAEIDAQATVLLGEAKATAQKMKEEAMAQRFALAVSAFGSAPAYNQWVFATGLPDELQLDFLYAGEGTFWTDLDKFSDAMLGRMQQADTKEP